MLSKIISSSFLGVEGYIVDVEVDISNGLPCFLIVGLADTAITESKERVKAAMKNNGFDIRPKRITVNLSPANIRKEGSSFDLAIAVGILASYNYVSNDLLKDYLIIGELSLGGEVKKCNALINAVITAKENNIKGVILPYENLEEAVMIKGVEIIPVKTLKELVMFLNKEIEITAEIEKKEIKEDVYIGDFSEVKGQEKAKKAMELSAAGGHNLLMIGSPGAGKSMLSKRMLSILPEMTEEEIIGSTKIYSSAGLLNKEKTTINVRPFRSPHHTSSDVALIGGGRIPKPGEISLAHNGVLFLDEIAEFSKRVLEVLRQPLEDKKVRISRASYSSEFPANFILIGAANPCPCGYKFEDGINSSKLCTCSPYEVKNYQRKLSGPIVDRMDLYVEFKRLSEDELLNYSEGESSKTIKKRVQNARKIQIERFGNSKTNSCMTSQDIKKYCKLDHETKEILKLASRNLSLSARGFDKILKLSRTIADLKNSSKIKKEHLLEALSFRKV